MEKANIKCREVHRTKVLQSDLSAKNDMIRDAYAAGGFKADRADGTGIFKSTTGGEYVGEFAGGRRWGHGKQRTSAGAVYTGDWTGDQRVGQGKSVDEKQNTFQGATRCVLA